jgi:type IX secretion system PorP/SprF family membrane protein
MNFKYIFLPFVLAFVAIQNLEAQQIATLNQYIYNPYIYNAAVAGTNGGNVYLNHRRQWNNMPGAPLTVLGSFDMLLGGGRSGVGMQLGGEKAGLNTDLSGKMSYAYHIPFDAAGKTKLSFGLSAGFFTQQFDLGRANASEQNDRSIEAGDGLSATAFTADAGLNFKWDRLNIGVSGLQLFSPNNLRNRGYVVGQDAQRTNLVPNVLMSARYLIGNKDGISVEPIVMVRTSKNQPVQVDLNALASWKQTVYLGAGYRSASGTNNVAGYNATLGMRVGKQVLISYGVESQLNTADNYASPFGLTHDILLGYRFGDAGKDEALEKAKETMRALENQVAMVSSKNDSLAKLNNDRLSNLENMTDALEKSKLNSDGLSREVSTLKSRLGSAESKIADLNNRPQTVVQSSAPAYIESSSNNSGNTNYAISGLNNANKLNSVFFAVNSSELSANAKRTLQTVANTLQNRSGAVVLNGAASQEGDKGKNMVLSMERSAAVKAYLERLGVKQTIFISPMGEEASKAAVRKDRRVDIATIGE